MATDLSQSEGPIPPDRLPSDQPSYLEPGHSFRSVTDKISAIVLTRPTHPAWLICFAVNLALVMLLAYAVIYLLAVGIGIWGVNIPVAWGFAITNFVWWIGIGHAGTLISAILLLLHQKWRTSINRLAEAMTIFAVMCAGVFPLLHLGRPWFFYWLLPYPDTMGLWPQFRSALVWDVFAVGTYFTVSLIFWYVGMIPDLATLRDRSPSRMGRVVYGILAMGWRSSAKHWSRFEIAYLLLGGLATPLVVSVHSVVSSDFAVTILPGWHETVFPPYFVAGAIFSGFAMVLALCIPLRLFYHLEDFITLNHLEVMAKILLATGFLTCYGYFIEQFMAWYGANVYEHYTYVNRGIGFGEYAEVYWTLLFCNACAIQILWFKRVRRSPLALLIVSYIVLVGMWLERYMIITTSLHRDFLPSSWGLYSGTIWDWATFFGTIGLFFVLFLLFLRVLPVISIAEMRALLPGTHAHEGGAMKPITPIYGLLAQFEHPEDILRAVHRAREEGYQDLDAYTPYPVEGLAEELGLSRTRVPLVVLIGGLVGGGAGFFMQWWAMAYDYPFNVGGRPLNSWPVFIPITFELMILVAAFAAILGMFFLNGLPMPYHPLFNVPEFARSTQDRFFLCIEATDARFDRLATRQFLESLHPEGAVLEVPH